MAKPTGERYIVGLDVGTSKVAAVVAEVADTGHLDIVGVGLTPSRGIRRGVIVNTEAAVESIRRAVEEAETMSGIEIDAVHLGLSGAHMRGLNTRGVVAVSGKNREIAPEDVRRAIDAAKAVTLPPGREIIHVLPQEFVVDDQDGIGQPVGMAGSRLEVNVHVVNTATSSAQNLVSCVNRAGVHVMDATLGQLAAAEAVLTNDEKELGVALVDIGGGTADLAVFERGAIWHTASVAIGGDHFTNDLAVGCRMPLPEAEKLKRDSGCALAALVGDEETVDVATIGGRGHRPLPRRLLAEILQPRAQELFQLLRDEVHAGGQDRPLHSGLVLVGGGAQLEGVVEVAEQIFDLPVRRGTPTGPGGLIDQVSTPELATVVGLVMVAARTNTGPVTPHPFGLARLRGMFRGFLE